MRGKDLFFNFTEKDVRITPAHAGKSIDIPDATDNKRDHPRTCGEKSLKNTQDLKFFGSPPHMRGKA